MNQAYARIPAGWWTTPKFLNLPPDAQRVLLALWSGPETPVCGVFPLSAGLIGERLKLQPRRVQCRLVELEDAGFVRLDPDAPQVWLLGYVEAQLGGMPASNRNWAVNTAWAIGHGPQTAMVREYRGHYQILEGLKGLRKPRQNKGMAKGVAKGMANQPANAMPCYARAGVAGVSGVAGVGPENSSPKPAAIKRGNGHGG